jgi:hypothetical protein
VARAQTAWRCSQCGTINEPGTRACSECGKWASLFDLQNTVDDVPVAPEDAQELEPVPFDPETFDPESFDPETFDPETFETDAFEPQPYETRPPQQPEAFEPEAADEDDEQTDRGRLRRWAISAIWVIGIIIWFVANTFGDR